MALLFVVLGIAVVAGVAVLVARDRPLIEDDPVGSRPLRWSASDTVDPGDIDAVRFSVAVRGYRMDEVDRVLDDTRRALSERDSEIATLHQVVSGLRRRGDDGGAPTPTTPSRAMARPATTRPAGAAPTAQAEAP